MRRSNRALAALAVPIIGLPLVAAPSAFASGPNANVQVVASHLDNPRGLDARGGQVWVAESGHGGSLCLDPSTCVGVTGAISRVNAAGKVTRVVTGLFSLAGPDGTAAGGPSDVSLSGGHIYAIMGGNTSGVPPTAPPGAQSLLKAARTQLGQLIKASFGGSFRPVAGVGDRDFRWAANHKFLVPDQFPDSNPNGLLAGDGRAWVADAGANTLDLVQGDKIKIEAFFPAPAGSETDIVPTCVDRGPDGALYVAELLGGTFAPGGARVWRVVPGHRPTVWATGLTTVNGCGFGPDGNFYATEFQTGGLNFDPTASLAGDVVRINFHSKKQTHLAVGQLTVPSGFAAGRHAIYVSNCSIAPATGIPGSPCADGGQLVRIGVG
jgi:hypothetical protein